VDGMPERILLVDDDKDFRTEFKESLSDYKVIEASSGQDALKLLRRPNQIDLVILDVMMPGLSGTEVMKEIRKLSPDISIIILTGYSSKEVAIEALKGHADDYLEKPMDIEKTREIIERFLTDRKGESGILPSDLSDKIQKVKKFVLRNCFKKVSLSDAAAAVCLSPKYLSRVFAQNTGKRFTEYRLEISINNAKKFLAIKGYNIDQIADKLGYKNTESFIRQFKKICGMTPTAYRNRIKKGRCRK
jgi:YesN/AraC family two-component response regulator